MEKELSEILDLHIRHYPKMTEQDLVKLIFQGEFGGGHLLTDFDRCGEWIEREYRQTKQLPDIPLYEDIGFGFARIQLSALDSAGLDPCDVAEMFFASASVAYGSETRYQTKLSCLPALLDDRFGFSGDQLRAFIEEYQRAGGGMLSHSEIYRQCYNPAYRVIFLNSQKG